MFITHSKVPTGLSRTNHARLASQQSHPYATGSACTFCLKDPTLRSKAHTHSVGDCGHFKRSQAPSAHMAAMQKPVSQGFPATFTNEQLKQFQSLINAHMSRQSGAHHPSPNPTPTIQELPATPAAPHQPEPVAHQRALTNGDPYMGHPHQPTQQAMEDLFLNLP